MSKKPNEDHYDKGETVARADAALKRMLSTPHEPHKPLLENKKLKVKRDQGRTITIDESRRSDQAIPLSDSEIMGWGVNDDETFGQLIAAQIDVPVFNLGISSYGAVREIMRVRMHARFKKANGMVIQYRWNDLDENYVFLRRDALPAAIR